MEATTRAIPIISVNRNMHATSMLQGLLFFELNFLLARSGGGRYGEQGPCGVRAKPRELI
jgi:hypothetical protein